MLHATHLGLPLRSYGGDYLDQYLFDGTVVRCLVLGSQNMDTLRADAALLDMATHAAVPLVGFASGAEFERALVGCFQDGVLGARLLRGTPCSDDCDGPRVGRAWSTWLLARSADFTPGDAPAQRIRDILVREVRTRHAGGMIRYLMSAVDTVRDEQA